MPGPSLSNEAIIAMAGPDGFARGLVYVRNGHVSELHFDSAQYLVFGRVRGSGRASYATSVQLGGGPGSSRTGHLGRCSCPVALDCKHAAAVLIAARGLEEISRLVQRSEWERVLSRLAASEERSQSDLPLGLEVQIEETRSYGSNALFRSLRARPLRRGSSGNWIRTGVAWDDLDQLRGAYRADHLELLLQLRAAGGLEARYVYPRTPWMSLGAVSPSIWPILARAGELGIPLIAAQGWQSVEVHPEPARVVLDVERSLLGDLELHAVLMLGESAIDLGDGGTLGDPAHGVYWTVSGTRPRAIHLAPLARALTGELRQFVNRHTSVAIPAEEESRFIEQLVPQLRAGAPVVSLGKSVEIPEPVRPELGCTVAFRPDHLIRLDWSFAYAVGTGRRFALDEPLTRPTVRDAAAERAVLEALSLPYARLPALRATDRPGPAPHVLLSGRDVVTFVADVLPLLAAQGIAVTIEGEPVDYRDAVDPPEVQVSAVEDPDVADWFDLRIQVSVDGEVIDFERLFVALARGEDVLILDSGVCVDLDRPQLARLRELIAESRALHDDDRPGQRISRFQASLWDELVQLGTVVEQSSQWSAAVRGLMDVTSIDPVEPPTSLLAELRPYQLEGYRWLSFLYDHGLGGILADDMGLGKTVQTLAQICRAREQAPDDPPFLVVAPTSVVSNWQHEADRFAPGLRVVVAGETTAKRKAGLAALVAGVDVVVTSYAVLRLDVEEFAAQPWRGMVLDEAQFVKNHRAKTYQCVRRVRAPVKLAITGTPLENNLMDLWALLSIVAPGLFPHPDRFSEFYRRPIERGQDADLLARLRRRIRPLMLRRTKESVAAELPPKQEQVLEVVLQPRHQRVYQTHLQRERSKILGLVDDLDRNRFTILRSLTLLRQLALDPSLVDPAHAGIPASKIDVLLEQLAELVAEGHRALVFSQFTGFLGKVRQRLDEAGIAYTYLDGRTRRRAEVIAQFTSGRTPVFLISLKAGGFGLNLTEADYCFVLDPWWNPATEAQAVDRTHRIGQTKTVMVYRLVAKDTIEEKVMELKARKEELFNAVLGGDTLADTALTADEIRALLAG